MNYGNYYQPSYYQLPQQQVMRVNGENGARAIRLAPNSSALALDETAPIVWHIVTDGAGYATQTPYDISVHQQPKPVDFQSFESRLSKVEEIINESYIRQHESRNISEPKPKSKSKSTESIDANVPE